MCRLIPILGLVAASVAPLAAQTVIPPTYPVHEDDFEGGSLENWVEAPGSVLGLVAGAGISGSTGLEVTLSVGESHLVRGSRGELARADEAYLTFRFDPNSVNLNDPGSGQVPGRSIEIAAIQGPGRDILVALRMRDVGGSFEAFLGWRDGNDVLQWDFSGGSFALVDGWQEITIGFRTDDWVAAWVDAGNVRSVSGVDHLEPYGAVVEIGKTNTAASLNPVGELRFDEVSVELPRINDLWVDQASGDDAYDGLTPGTAFATISRASDLAGAGTVVHIQPGVYRETLLPAQGGLPGEPAQYKAEAGPGTAVIRGAGSGADLAWQQLASNTIGLPATVDPAAIWWADLSSWALTEPPHFVVGMSPADSVQERFPMAREPDWEVTDPSRHSLWWWVANGGSAVAACDPTTDPDEHCDVPQRSELQLTDDADDSWQPGIEPGNLSTLGSLVGATLVARDCTFSHYEYRRTITAHAVGSGRVTVDQACLEDSGDPGLGWGSQYYVENHPRLLDNPGEWWFDVATGRLYFWPPTAQDPATLDLEISRFDTAVLLGGLSHVTFEDLDIELFNGLVFDNRNLAWQTSVGNRVAGCSLRYADRGLLLSQGVEAGSHEDKGVDGFEIEDNEIAHMDHEALRVTYYWNGGSVPATWSRAGTHDTLLRANWIHHIGFRQPSSVTSGTGVAFWYADRATIEGNTISDMARNGVQLTRSIIQSPGGIQTGEILVKDNIIERACQQKTDCGALRVFGRPPDTNEFHNVLLIGNTLRDTFGWSWPGEMRRVWTAGHFKGSAGNGIYFDGASGVHVYRNISYNNGHAGINFASYWREGAQRLINNVLADNVYGIRFGGIQWDSTGNFDTRAENNILINNEAYGFLVLSADPSIPGMTLDHNLYHRNGWGTDVFKPGAMKIGLPATQQYHQTLAEIQANTSFETAGQTADPAFLSYDPDDHDRFDSSRPDFRLRAGSPAEDAGSATLPASLDAVLAHFGLTDPPLGAAYDQGRFEGTTPCGDETVDNLTVTTAETFEACGTLTLGPVFEVNTPGVVTAVAGEAVVLVNDTSIGSGASLTAGHGGLPPP